MVMMKQMSLISQNAAFKRPREEGEGEEAERRLLSRVDEARSASKGRDDASQKEKRKEKRKVEKEKKMKQLESSLFGSIYSPLEFGNEDGTVEDVDGEKKTGGSDEPLFFVDKSIGGDGEEDVFVYEEDLVAAGGEGGDEEGRREGVKRPAWVDEEEEVVNVNIGNTNRLRKLKKDVNEGTIPGGEYVARLRAQHAKLNPGTEWARGELGIGDESDEDGSDGESGITVSRGYTDDAEFSGNILKSDENLVLKSGTKLLPGLLEYTRLMDANGVEPSSGPINSVQFHRNGQLVLIGGLDRRLRFFQVDGKRNAKIQSIFVEDCPIRKASFLPDGSQVIISGRRNFFYSFDLVKAKVDKIGPLTGREEKSLENFEVSPDSSTIAFIGNEGYILLVSSKTKGLIATLKMNGSCRSLAFANDGKMLMSSGGDGQIYHWDLRTRKCIHKAVDEGCLTGSALCASPVSSLFAAGSGSGIVNIYRREDFMSGKYRPLKTVENLTTTIEQVKFNHDAQILAIISTMKRSSLKLVHIPSFTVFSNFPPPNSSLQYPRCLDFSPGGGFMAVGNAAGRVLLYKLHHYQNA